MATNNTWNSVSVSIYWRADRHTEGHSISYQRPTEENPTPKRPVVVGELLSYSPLPMSSEWGQLFALIKVVAFDEQSLTVMYGKRKVVLTPNHTWEELGESGMNYTSFYLSISINNEEKPEEEPEQEPVAEEKPEPLKVTHDEEFLRRFRTKDRIVQLSKEDIKQVSQQADQGDAFAQYAYGRWLYAINPWPSSTQEAEKLFIASKEEVPDALATYALMWRYGDTHENVMDIEKSEQLLDEAIQRGSVRAVLQHARIRIYGMFCEAGPAKVAVEIEERLSRETDPDPQWYTLLGYAYKEMEREDDAIIQYEKGAELGETANYFNLYAIYYLRGNTALAEEYVEEGIEKGDGLCCIYQADTSQDDYEKMSRDEKIELHETIDDRLHLGLERRDGTCAYYLYLMYYYGILGFPENKERAFKYLEEGVRLGDTTSIAEKAQLAEDGQWPKPLNASEIGELWLKAVRYSPSNEDYLLGMSRVNGLAFLTRHKDELERYWMPRFPKEPEVKAKADKTPIDPSVIIIWPTGHLDIVKADVYKMKSFREMAETLIGAEGLDAVHYSPLLHTIGEAAELDLSLVMYVDRDGMMKDLDDNAIGTMLYGQGMEIRGPIIICLEDQVHDCYSFKTVEDLTATYSEIDKHCGGLLIIKDEDDGRYDAFA